MVVTIELDDELLLQANRFGSETGRPLPEIIEEGLRAVLPPIDQKSPYRLPDRSAGSEDAPDALEKLSWRELRDIIYGDDDRR